MLYARSRTLLGSDHRGSIDGYGGAVIALEPALPIGADRHHLVWLASSLWSFDQFFAALAPHADVPIDFVTRPEAFLFFRTSTPEHPSEYFAEGCIGYNLDGPLNETHRAMHETLFHELFHLNDERRGGWSTAALEPLFDGIVARCGDEHGCYAPFAPSDTVVPGGTYYGFDARTRHVSEYAAEVALRYYLEHEAIVFGRKPLPPFKCGGEENFVAWDSIARAFFGGVDLVRDCAVVERTNDEG